MTQTANRMLLTCLRDGTRVGVRPLAPRDRTCLAGGMALLSERSRYRRFGAPIRRLSESQLRYLTDVDQVDHVAWGALDLATGQPQGVAVVRYVRLGEDRTVAEPALTVIDSHQARGLGTLLLGLLCHLARQSGIRTMVAQVLSENEPMLGLLSQLGVEIVSQRSGTLCVRREVPASPDSYPDTPAGRRLRDAHLEMSRLAGAA